MKKTRQPPPRRAPSRAPALGEVIMDHMGIRAATDVDFDAIEKLLAAPVDAAAVRLNRLRERDKQEDKLRGLDAALRAAPDDVVLLEAKAHCLKTLERRSELLDVYRHLQRLAPARADLRHMIAALSGAQSPARASDDYVRQEFDSFAENFDATLANWLEYRAPQHVADTVRAALGEGRTTATTIDLGCGTGLAAPLLRPLTKRLEGVDLSPRMLDRARARGGYDALFEDEIGRFLSSRRNQYTLAVACDVFCYFGELAPAFVAVAVALKPGGLFAFTVERCDGDGHVLGASGRYAHSDAFVRAAAAAAGLALLSEAEVTLRTELHRPVIGGCYLLRRA
jgi:predicted TPR repeat methyltransferase